MAKGLTLDELRNQLDTEARKECDKQQEKINDLTMRVASLTKALVNSEGNVVALQKRCKSLTNGTLCCKCAFKGYCDQSDAECEPCTVKHPIRDLFLNIFTHK